MRITPLVALCGTGLLVFISYDLARHPILPLFATSLGAPAHLIGLVVGASTLTGVVLKFPAGYLSDRLGRRTLLLAAGSVLMLVPFLYSGIQTVWQLMGLRLVHGLATALFAPVAMAIAAELDRTKTGEHLGWYSAFSQTGRLLGRSWGGVVVQAAGFANTFRLAGLVGGVSLISMLIGFSSTGPPPPPLPSGERDRAGDLPTRPGLVTSARELFHNAPLLTASGLHATAMLGIGAYEAFLPLFSLSIGLSPATAGLLLGIQTGSSLVSKPFAGRLVDRVGAHRLIPFGLLLCAASLSLTPLFPTLPVLVFLAVGLGIGEAVMAVATSVWVAAGATRHGLGAALGAYGAIMDIGHASGPILAGILIMALGNRGMFLILGALLAGSALFALLWLARHTTYNGQQGV